MIIGLLQNARFFLRKFIFCFGTLLSKMFCIAGWRLAKIVLYISDLAISV